MPPINPNSPDPAVFLLTHIGNDARNAAAVLGKASIPSRICTGVRELCETADAQTGALIIGEEILDQPSLACLLEFLKRQPPWSDIPIVLLTKAGEIQKNTYDILDFLGTRANVTLLEKPLRAITLISVIRTALRARKRQYEVRSLLEDYTRAVENAQTATAKFQAIFEQSSVFAGIMTLDGNMTEVNRLCLDLCGYRAAEVLGRPLWECGWWRGSKEVQEKIRKGTRRAAQGTLYKEVLPYLWADGTKRMVEFALYPIRDEGGRVIFLHPTWVDVTERQQADARAEFLIRLTQKLSVVSDPSEINRIATQEIGQFLGVHRCYFFQPQPDLSEVRVMPDWHRDYEPGLEGNYRLDEFGRPEFWHAVRFRTITVDDVGAHPWTKEFLANYRAVKIIAFAQAPFIHEGRWVACVAVSSDQPRQWTAAEESLLENAVARVWPLIERARAEAALREANALLASKASQFEKLVQQRTMKLQETVGELESFSYSIAHDMRAPLRSLQSFSGILLADCSSKLDADGQELLQRIAKAADRMDKLIRDVLDYSRVVRADLLLEKVDVEQLLRDIIDTYPMLAPDKADILLKGPFPSVLGNEAILTQVFSNLMGNAVKFVPPGVRPRLKLWAEPRDRRVRVFVQDNGIGIEPGQHEKIFGIFQQVDKSFEGTGIGLAIVKKAVERIGGKVGLQSELNKGSTFWIDVKAAEAESPQEQANETRTRTPVAETHSLR